MAQFQNNSYEWAKTIVKRNKRLNDRIYDLVKNGYIIATRYALKKNGHLSPCSLEVLRTKNEIRMIVGYRPNHHSREAICVIWEK